MTTFKLRPGLYQAILSYKGRKFYATGTTRQAAHFIALIEAITTT